MSTVRIRRSGNVLEVCPTMEDLLGPALQYAHRKFDYDPRSGGATELVDTVLYRVSNGALYTTQGALDRIRKALHAAGVEYTYEDLRPNAGLQPDYDRFSLTMPGVEFRKWQDEIMAHLIAYDSGVIVAPTAYGKTFLMLAMTALYPKSNIIITSPSTALINSTYRRLLDVTPHVGRVGGGHNEPDRVTLSTYQSLQRCPLDRCDILLVDECHQAVSPQASADIARIRNPAKIFGMTATISGRSDGADLAIEVLLGPVIYRIPYDKAAEEGLVSKIKVGLTDVEGCQIDTYRFTTRPAKRRWAYWRNKWRNEAFARAIIEYPPRFGIEDPQVLVLCSTTEHAFRLASLLPGFQVVYAGMTKDRRQKLVAQKLIPEDYKPLAPSARERMLREFETGKLRRVIATGHWGQGVDFRYLDVVANASGERSPITTEQWAGRNSRIYEGKRFGLLIDSMDTWDKWARGRANTRIKIYRDNDWEIYKPKDIPNGEEKQGG